MIPLSRSPGGIFTEVELPARPYGLRIKVSVKPMETPPEFHKMDGVVVEPPSQVRCTGTVEGRTASGRYAAAPMDFALPIVDENGFFRLGGTQYVVCRVGMPSPWHPMKFGKCHFLDRGEVIKRVIEDIFGPRTWIALDGTRTTRGQSVLSPFFFGTTPTTVATVNPVQLQTRLNSLLVSHPFVRQVEDKPRQRAGWKDAVILLTKPWGLKVEPFLFPKDMWGCLDPSSTSASETINRVYQMAHGARIEHGHIVPGESVFCEFTRRNSVALNFSAKRAYLLRSAVMGSADLVERDERPVDPEGSLVHTKNCTTAIMDMGPFTFEDMIAVSESCAKRFAAQDTQRLTRWSPRPIEKFFVSVGDTVEPLQVLAEGEAFEFVSEEHESGEEAPRHRKVVASELREASVLEEIRVCPYWHSGRIGVRTIFTFRTTLPLRTGDKITCFGGNKGIVRVVPNNWMPILPDGRTVDICVSPFSVASRRVMSMMMEMVIGREWERGEFEKKRIFGDQDPTTWSHVSMAGSKVRLKWRGVEFPSPTFWGVMPWMRLAKSGIATRRAAAVGSERPLTGEGILPDLARVAGQSLDPSKSLVLVSKGMQETLKAIVGDSPGLKFLGELVEALEGPSEDAARK